MAGRGSAGVQELVEFLKANGIAEFDMERTDLKVRLKFAGLQPRLRRRSICRIWRARLRRRVRRLRLLRRCRFRRRCRERLRCAAAPAAEAGPEAGAHIVKSPIVGTFYESPSPDAAAFVKLGDQVSNGQVLCIVEAMKLMNEIESDVAGEIVKVYVKARAAGGVWAAAVCDQGMKRQWLVASGS